MLCHFLADLFDVLSKLSVQQFQPDQLILPCAVSLLEETVSNITPLPKRPVLGGRHTFMCSLQACNGSFMFQDIILSGDASRLTPVEITHTNVVGAHIKRATDLCLSGLKQRFGEMLQRSDINKTALAPCGLNQAVSRTFWSLIMMHGLQTEEISLILTNSQLSALSSGYSQPLRARVAASQPYHHNGYL